MKTQFRLLNDNAENTDGRFRSKPLTEPANAGYLSLLTPLICDAIIGERVRKPSKNYWGTMT
jgi:hypothetical protein